MPVFLMKLFPPFSSSCSSPQVSGPQICSSLQPRFSSRLIINAPSSAMGDGSKRRRVTAPASSSRATDNADICSRYEKLLALRETGPEAKLGQFRRLAAAESAALSARCDAQARVIAVQEETIAGMRERLRGAEDGLGASERARAESERARAESERAGGRAERAAAAEREAERDAGRRALEEKAEEGRAEAEAASAASAAAAAGAASAAAAAGAGVAAAAAEAAAASDVERRSFQMLQIFSGAAAGGVEVSEDGIECHKFTVSSPALDQFVVFTLSSTGEEGYITYEPIEVQLRDRGSDIVFTDALDFEAKYASAVLQEILKHVLRLSGAQGESASIAESARKSTRKTPRRAATA